MSYKKSQDNGKSSNLLGTPVRSSTPQSHGQRSAAPSPSSSIVHKSQSQAPLFGQSSEESRSPVKLQRQPSNMSYTATASPSPTIVPSFAGSNFGDNAELVKAVRNARPRIVADPSIASSFKMEDDPELYDLFLR